MKYIVALGNPGDAYIGTRHNVGWEVLDAFADRYDFSAPELYGHLRARVRKGTVGEEIIWLIYPDTFMNNSGESVTSLLQDDPKAEIIIVHDDSALSLGALRIVRTRGAGGHNGVQSIFNHTHRTDFTRLRIGISPVSWWSKQKKVVSGKHKAAFVLQKFSFWEKPVVQDMLIPASDALCCIVTKGADQAMNKYNKTPTT